MGVAALFGVVVGGWAAWLLTSVLSTWVYLGVVALEIAASRALHINLGEKDPEER